jgi:hypothetical protein
MAPDMQQQPPVFYLSDVQCKSGAHLNCIAYDSSSSSSTTSRQPTGSLYPVYEVCFADADTNTTKATQVHSVSTAANVFSSVDLNCCVHLLTNDTSWSNMFIGGNTTESCMRTDTVVYMQLILTMCTTTHVNFAGFTWHKS